MAQRRQMGRLAKRITRQLQAHSGRPLQLRQGKIISTSAGPPVSVGVQLGGSTTTITGVRYLAGYTPTVNDGVWVLVQGPLLIVVNKLA